MNLILALSIFNISFRLHIVSQKKKQRLVNNNLRELGEQELSMNELVNSERTFPNWAAKVQNQKGFK